MSAPPVARSQALGGVRHAFLGRPGGVSHGLFSSLNVGLGSGDDPAAVRENRVRAVLAAGGADALVTLRQVHSARALAVAWPIADDARPEADALATNRRGLMLGVLTADCAPVLLADAHAGVVGAAHAGWKGARGGVIEAVVAVMEELGAERHRIAAAIGPCIAQASYEVTDAFVDAFGEPGWFAPGRPGHRWFDLERYVAARLREAGIAEVEPLAIDTYADPDRWFSYRRATHAGERDYGRQIATIALR